MALDGIYFSNIVNELKKPLLDAKVNKIAQPEADTIILQMRSQRENYKLLLTSNSNYARIHFTTLVKENPMQAPLFLMVLRKNLVGARLNEIKQIDGDRIINLHFMGYDEFGYDDPFILSIEMMGKHSNIILIRESNMTIVDCIKHVSSLKNSYRTLLPGKIYKAPPASVKLNPLDYTDEELLERGDPNNLDPEFFSRLFSGISRRTSHDLFATYQGENPLPFIRSILKHLGNSYDFYILKDGPDYKDVTSYPFTEDHVKFDSPSEALETFVREKDFSDRMKSKTSDLHKILQNNLQRVRKKITLLEKSIEDSKDKEKFKLRGEILSANVYAIEEGSKEVTLLNYYTGEDIRITLNPMKNISQNIENYYQKYNKKKRAEVMARGQKIIAQEEENYLMSILLSLTHLETETEIQDIRQELMVAGYLRLKKTTKKKPKASKPLHFISSEGIDIYVGKNNTQNDYLTTKFANRSDTWLHTKDIPGSHVIIRSDEFNEKTLFEAANLAAFYSKASNSTKVPVDYTQVKNVKKPSGSKPGMVIYSTNKTLYMDPEAPRLDRQE
ncbi:MAG: fibronectin/fibrinogen-binding protein [Clostridium sp.]|jgi:predicted ribosome quality control (RQC) complex YloA/Tae2 family protein|nr:fibronectin/fibrinogen-binding protein [Clostridium sp.]